MRQCGPQVNLSGCFLEQSCILLSTVCSVYKTLYEDSVVDSNTISSNLEAFVEKGVFLVV